MASARPQVDAFRSQPSGVMRPGHGCIYQGRNAERSSEFVEVSALPGPRSAARRADPDRPRAQLPAFRWH